MPDDLFQSCIKQFASWNVPLRITPQFYGEFFLNPEWLHCLQYIETTAPKAIIEITTNGSLLDDFKLTELLNMTNVKYIGFSVYAFFPETHARLMGLPPYTLGRIETAVKRISEERPDINMTIGYTIDQRYLGDLESEMIGRKWGDLSAPHFISYNSQHNYNRNYPCQTPCANIFDRIVILSDGRVTPCCFDSEGELDIGNAYENDLLQIYRGEKALRLRAAHECGERDTIPLCKSCTQST